MIQNTGQQRQREQSVRPSGLPRVGSVVWEVKLSVSVRDEERRLLLQRRCFLHAVKRPRTCSAAVVFIHLLAAV